MDSSEPHATMASPDEQPTVSGTASTEAGSAATDAPPATPRTEPPSRFSHIKEKLRMIGSKSKKLNFNSMTALVEEARANRSTVNQNSSIAGSELAALLAIPADKRQAITWREIIEYGRKVELPLPDSLTVKQRLCAWHRCMTKMQLVELADGAAITQQGDIGTQLLWLLKGAATGADAHDVQPLELISKEPLQGQAYTSSVTAVGQACCAALSCTDLNAAVEEALQLSLSSSVTSALKPLLLLPRQDRSRIHLEDIATKLSTYEPYRQLDPEFRSEVGSITEYISAPAGSTLFSEGDKVCFCFVILSGSVEMRQTEVATGVTTTTCTLSVGEHFGTLSTLLGNDKRRSTCAIALEDCEFAAINRVTYNRLQKKQLQDAIDARMELVKSMSVLVSAPDTVHTRVAFNSCTDAFSPGQTILNPACYPSRLFIVMEGECKLVWATDDPSRPPEEPMTVSEHHALHHSGLHHPAAASSSAAAAHSKHQLSPRAAYKSSTGDTTHASSQEGGLTSRRSTSINAQGNAAGSASAGGHSDASVPSVSREPSSHKLRRNSSTRGSGHLPGAPSLQSSLSQINRSGSMQLEQSQDIPVKETTTTCGCGCTIPAHAAPPRYRHMLEIARLGRGDIINGAIMSGMAPALSAIASTTVRVMAIDGDAVESVFGTSVFNQLKGIVARQFELNRQRLQQVVAMRQTTSNTLLNSSLYRQMSEDPTSQAMFLEHYVSPGPSDLLPAPAAEPAASARGQKAVGGVTLPALPPGSLSTTLHTRSASMVAGGAPPISARGTPAQLSVASGGAAAVTSLLGSLSPGMDSAPGMSLEDAFAVRTRTASVPPQPSGPSGTSPSRRGHSSHAILPALPAPASSTLPIGRSISGTGQASQSSSPSAPKHFNALGLTNSRNSLSTSSTPQPDLPHSMWAGNMHACFGDMFEMLAEQANAEAMTVPASQSAPTTPPMLATPALIAKAKVQPAVSSGAARACVDRGRLLMSVDSALGAVVAPQQRGRLAPSPGAAAAGLTDDALARSVAVLPGRLTTYESILRPLAPKKDKRIEMLHELAVTNNWGLKRSPQAQREEAQLKYLQAVKLKQEKARQREIARKQQEAQANLGWGTVEKVRRTSDALSAHDMMASGLVSRSDSRNSLGFGQTATGGRLSHSGSSSSFRVRSVKAWQRPDEEVNLPLDRDALAPSLQSDRGHGLSQPRLQDIKYILGRWGERWASDREVAKRTQQQAEARRLSNQRSSMGSRFPDEEELQDLDLYGAPTFGPGL